MKKRLALVGVLAGVLMLAPRVNAEVPNLIRYQGQLTNSQGVPLEGPYDLTFRLYDAEAAGTVLWQELQPAVSLSGGQFSVLLGAVTSLAQETWAEARWLSIQVNGEAELAPRQRITSVPLAVRAGTAEALATPVTTSTITDDANALVPAGAVILWTGSSCPTGYARLTALDGKFLMSNSAYEPNAGGSDSHNHAAGTYSIPGHNHSGSTGTNSATKVGSGGADNQYIEPLHPHTHSIPSESMLGVTGTSGMADSRPAFATILLCQRD